MLGLRLLLLFFLLAICLCMVVVLYAILLTFLLVSLLDCCVRLYVRFGCYFVFCCVNSVVVVVFYVLLSLI